MNERKDSVLRSIHFAVNILDPAFQRANHAENQFIAVVDHIFRVAQGLESTSPDDEEKEHDSHIGHEGFWENQNIWSIVDDLKEVWNTVCYSTLFNKVATVIIN